LWYDGREVAYRSRERILRLKSLAKPLDIELANDIIFKGAVVQGINGRRLFDTWYKMQALLKSGALDLAPLITDRMPMADFEHGRELLLSGNASKVLTYPNGLP
jgi:threonine 3-dehydrogenase